MKKITITLTEEDMNNLFVFLDRATYTGLKEINAVQSIINTFKTGEITED